ncbi:MAG: Clp protease ClpP, partial [Alphaproteobacteria bacterium]|nr:Clp protease ClpP [Alphaproteobacteria bacterium]
MPKIIELSGVVGAEITAKNLKNRLPKDGSDVLLKIDSVGGSVFEGNRLFNALNDHLNKFPGTITAELGAVAASAASYFPLAIGAENLKVRKNTTFMGHKAWTFAIGNADDMKAEAEILDGFDNIIAKVYSGITGKSVDDSLEDMKNEFWLIGGESVVDAGFASGIVDEDQTEPEEQNVIEKSEVLAMMKESKNKIREIENQEDLNKWAAKIEKTLNAVDVEADGQKLLFSESAPSGAKNKSEVDMNLSEYLDQNPEAKAEYTEKLNTA